MRRSSFEELARGCVSTAAYLSIHNMVAWMIDRFGDAAQRRRFLPKLMTMEHFASYCLTEPGAGSDAASLADARGARRRSLRRQRHQGLHLRRRRERHLCRACCAPAARARRASRASWSRRARPASPSARKEKKLGWNSQPTAMVIFEDCRVPVANRLGAEGDGFKIAMMGLDGGRINIGACSLGGARACLEAARRHLRERRQFGKQLAEFQALQFRLADMATELEAARLMVHRAARALDAGDPDATLHCAMAKRFATDAGFHIANEALQLHGGYGYLKDFPDRALSARPARPSDPRRHQRDHARHHRPPPARAMSDGRRDSVRAARRARHRHAQPAEGAQHPVARDVPRASIRRWRRGPSDPAVARGAGARRGRARLLRRRRRRGDLRGARRTAGAGDYKADFFREEYSAHPPHPSLPQALRRAHRRHHHGRRRRASPSTAAFRVATERTLFAMPEVQIGLFPDVGATPVPQSLPGPHRPLSRR